MTPHDKKHFKLLFIWKWFHNGKQEPFKKATETKATETKATSLPPTFRGEWDRTPQLLPGKII